MSDENTISMKVYCLFMGHSNCVTQSRINLTTCRFAVMCTLSTLLLSIIMSCWELGVS